MNAALFLIIGCAVLVVGYIFYGGWLAKKWGVDNSRPTPAHTMEDGKDYCPAKAPVLMGHHFSSIAGAGPINGPIQAAVFGWVPVMLWVLIGGIFFGGVHDFGALFASIRHKGESIGEVIGDAIGAKAKKLFITFAYLTLILVVAAFASIVANTFKATYTADGAVDYAASAANASTAIISIMFILMAIIFGFFVYRRNAPLGISTIIGVIGIVVCMVIGLNWHPIYLSYTVWMIIVGLYIGVASVTPVWILLQPRDYLSSFLLYGMMILAVVGIIGAHPIVDMPAFLGFEDTLKPTGTSLGYMFPALFVTIACGAVSGFHSLVSSGTSSKTVSNEKDMLFIGYGSMLIESILAVVSLIVVGAAATGGVMPKGTPFQIFAGAVGGFMGMFGLSAHVATCVITMCVSALALTTLDSVGRIGRMCFQELFTSGKPEEMSGLQKVLTNKYFATVITLFFGYLLCLGGYMNVWPLFGAANQLCAALVFISLSVFLKVTGRQGWMLYVPMGFMFAATMSALAMSIYGIVNKLVTGAPFGMLTDGLQLVVAIALIILALLIATNGLKTLCGSKAGSKNETANA